MSGQRTGEPTDVAEWEAFRSRHAGHRFLDYDPLYALSESLIESIKRHVPDFFRSDEERFERDLARTASFGFPATAESRRGCGSCD